ncbi:MAG: AAA family ATPase [Ardenticatenaceae bacterium]|nr:AAA family ATPase [Ardenticatenaceae bacterium]
MRGLSEYLPIDRRLALAQGRELPEGTHGVALFADISGFTPLTAVLAQQLGPQRGAEELARQLNLVYGAIIAEVHQFGGSVIGFSGDAITCWFDGQRQPQAAAAAFAIQNGMNQFQAIATPGGTAVSLTIKVSLAAGPARRLLVGDPQYGLLEVMAGATLDRMAIGENLAEPGEVLISQELVEPLQNFITVVDWREGEANGRFAVTQPTNQPIPPLPWHIPALPDNQTTRAWLLPPVYERLERGQGEFLTELRSTTPLFMKFSGIDYDEDEAAREKLDGFIKRVQAVIGRYEGFLLQLTMGDKGSYFYAVFGAPIAHENDPERAVMAALELRSLAQEFDYIQTVQIGISRGRMRVGAYGSRTRRTYGALGNETNLAARLMIIAQPGQILVTTHVAESVSRAFQLHSLGRLSVKGVADDLPVFAVEARQQGPQLGTLKGRAVTQIVGRIEERGLITAKIEALVQGQGGCLIVEGEAGIGKSRLIAEIPDLVQTADLTYLLGEASAIEQATPYHAWRFIFSQLLSLDIFTEKITGALRQGWQEQVLTFLQQRLPEQLPLAPLLNVLLPLDLPDNELTAQMTGEVRADNTRELLLGILQTAVTPNPLILVLEDAQWLDSASWTLARLAHRNIPALLLILVTRPLTEPYSSEYRQLLQAERTEVLSLNTLPMPDIIQLVCQRLGVAALPQPVINLIQEKAEGHPFFSEELAYALRDAGLIHITDGICQLAPEVDNLDALLPDTIEGVIVSRIDRLPAQTQLTLKVASVIGRIFALRLLTNIYPLESDTPQIKDHLVQLESLDITILETPEPDISYFFRHIITQQVTYNLISFAQRHQLHHVVADWYERNHHDDLASFYPLLAYHWQRAENREKAIDYLAKAGEQALHNNTNQEAVNFFSEALALLGQESEWWQRARWLRYMGTAHYRLGHMQESQRLFQEALALLQEPLPTTTGQLQWGLLRRLWGQIKHRWGGRWLLKTAVNHEKSRLIEAVEVYRVLISIYFITNESDKFLHATLAALNMAERADYPEAMPEGYGTMGIIMGILRRRWADSYFTRAVRIAEELNTPSAIGMAYSRRGVYYSTNGFWRKGLLDYQRGIEAYQLINDQRNTGDCLNFFMRGYYGLGNFPQTIEYATALYTMAQKNGNTQHEAWGLMFEAMARLALGQWQLAANLAEKAQTVLGQNITDTDILCIRGVLANTHLQQGNVPQGLALAQEVRDILLASSPVLAGVGDGYGLALAAYVMVWENKLGGNEVELQQSVAKLCKVLRRFIRTFDPSNSDFVYWQGRHDWLTGAKEKAITQWQTAVTLAQSNERLYAEGRARVLLGRYAPLSQVEQRQQWQRALLCFETMQAAADLAAVRTLLDGA